MDDLKGKVAIVTGGTRGIGKGISEILSKEGCRVIIIYNKSAGEANEVVEILKKWGGISEAIQADVSKYDQVDSMVKRVIDKYGKIDILINNAGKNIDGPFLNMSQEAMDKVIDTNLKGTFNCSQIVANEMIDKHVNGSIINISASTALRGRRNGANYCVAKAGVVALTKCIALELAPNVRVNCIIPGFIETDEVVERYSLNDANTRSQILSTIPIGRFGKPDDIGNIIAFLCSEKASYITGQLFFVNGGNYTG